MDAILIGVDREHLDAAIADGLVEVSFGSEVWPDPLSFPVDVPAFFYEVRAEAMAVATYRATFVRYEADPGTLAFERRLDPTRPSSTKWRRKEGTLPDDERETPSGGYLFFRGLRRLEQPVHLSKFRVHGRPFGARVVRRPYLVEWTG